ncbi:S1 family peptidase [Phreatobacter stygius]|uniref:Trypsin-like peptidase domain-containing protein n=1 Tax=Phreatobacter stygius TaxID=1940610 RepID=A0A4D7B7I7_9HYPH|nr:serine protease [Phreatobacter stygius]QCI64102.1 trypsin-like peptidase domain-containing protein [Phreatobacter stygius]
MPSVAVLWPPAVHAQQRGGADRNNPDVFIVNRYSAAITRLYASPVSDDNWGRDRLSGTSIAAGQRGELRPERGRGCIWDIKVIYQNGREEEKRRQGLCEVSEVVFDGANAIFPQGNQATNPTQPTQPVQPTQPTQPTQPAQPTQPTQPAQPPRAADTMIINQGPAVIVQLFAQGQNATDWGRDRLSTSTLRATGRFHLRLASDQGCIWNLRFVFAGGGVETRQAQNLCELPELTVAARAQPGQVISSGTGFYVSRFGHVLTTFHSVRNCSAVSIARPGGQRVTMVRVADDAEFDLALYQVPDLVSPVAPFRLGSAGLRLGETVVIVGYPARRVLGAVAVVSSTVTATSGSGSDQNRFQFQGGAVEEPWGAPIYDGNGLVVGIANDPQFIGRPGTGIQRDAIARFLRRNNVEITEVAQGEARRLPTTQDYAFPVVLPLDCVQ